MGVLIAGLMHVVSVGRVSLPDPAGPVRVELDQLAQPDDLAGLAVVAREAIELARSPGLRDLVGGLYADADGRGIEAVESDETAFLQWLRGNLGGYHHLAGSCRIGVAVDPGGALRGYEGVVVADASALPGVPSRNPYLTVVRHAENVASGLRRT
jgi:choline dehydrogenase